MFLFLYTFLLLYRHFILSASKWSKSVIRQFCLLRSNFPKKDIFQSKLEQKHRHRTQHIWIGLLGTKFHKGMLGRVYLSFIKYNTVKKKMRGRFNTWTTKTKWILNNFGNCTWICAPVNDLRWSLIPLQQLKKLFGLGLISLWILFTKISKCFELQRLESRLFHCNDRRQKETMFIKVVLHIKKRDIVSISCNIWKRLFRY